jgi:hypothetical protein
MTEFQAYLTFGFEHILNFRAYDHILFIATLVAAYPAHYWKRMLVLITAFTLGHCTTLALSALDIFSLNRALVEVLIAATILITAGYNLLQKGFLVTGKPRILLHYIIALSFGLIHGLGFAGQFRALIGSGAELITTLLAFNIGVELGQIIVIALLLSMMWILVRVLHFRHECICLAISVFAAGVALILIIQRALAL